MKLEEILREVDGFLKLHKASGNMNVRNIDAKSKEISILTLTEEMSAADPKVAKLPYLNVILTNGVKLKYYMAPPRYSVTRLMSNDDLVLVAVDASPVESAVEAYLAGGDAVGQGPLITKFHRRCQFLPFQIDCGLADLKVLEYQSYRNVEVFVVTCNGRLFVVSLLETVSKEKIASARELKNGGDD